MSVCPQPPKAVAPTVLMLKYARILTEMFLLSMKWQTFLKKVSIENPIIYILDQDPSVPMNAVIS